MKYECELPIDASLEKLSKAFMDPEGIYAWMEGLESMELPEGEEGKKGAKTRMNFKSKNRSFSMIETLWENNLPEVFPPSYMMGAVTNKYDGFH